MPSEGHPPVRNRGGRAETDASQPKRIERYYIDSLISLEGHSPAQNMGDSSAEPDTSHSKGLESYYGILPKARGFCNGFTGEIVDAGYTAIPFCFLGPYILSKAREDHSKSESKKRSPQVNGKAISRGATRAAAVIQSAYIGAGLLAGFTLLSTLGIDYRSILGIGVERGVDPQRERAATRATVLGAAAGTAAGFGISSLWKAQSRLASELIGVRPRIMPLKRLPLSLGMGCIVAAVFNSAGHVLYSIRRRDRKKRTTLE